ncbi:MAG: hypothetical protein M3Y56_01600 [Armatimonadota bacterium]|nr:hypothetical protein [Armatimonadota bacterium]
MLTSIEGTYYNGQIELNELPAEVQNGTPVVVTFLSSSEIDLGSHGIDQRQAAELRAALSTFGDWNDPTMELYDDYDAAKAIL